MREEEDLTPSHDDLAEALRKLRPSQPESAIARDAWFEAGYRAGRKAACFWRAAAAFMVVGMVAVAMWERRQVNSLIPQTPVAIDQGQITSTLPAQTVQAIRGAEYARLRGALLQEGLRGLGDSALPSGNPSLPPGIHDRDRRDDNYWPKTRG